MKTEILSDSKMRELGFTDHIETEWFYSESLKLSDNYPVSLNITINKKTSEYDCFVEAILFGQMEPYYDYSDEKEKKNIILQIDNILKKLNDSGMNLHIDHSMFSFRKYE